MCCIELHTASAFSFLDGASLPKRFVERAAALGYPALALLDRDGVYGAPRFHQAAPRAGIKAIVGAELTIDRWGACASRPGRAGRIRHPDRGHEIHDRRASLEPRIVRLPVLVESREGYRNLCRLVTRMKLRAPKGEGALTLDELDGARRRPRRAAGRAALAGARYGVGGLLDRLVGIFGARTSTSSCSATSCATRKPTTTRCAICRGVSRADRRHQRRALRAPAGDRPLFDVLTCIRHKTTLERAGRRLARTPSAILKPPAQMARLFADRPEAIAGDARARRSAAVTRWPISAIAFPTIRCRRARPKTSFLRKITEVGARERYRPYHDRARAQIARELDLIEKLDLAGYFLIVWDIVNFCRQQDILVQGRGSAANSAVCYSLGITAVDPVGMDLLFERFLSEERGEWPDIDLDLPSGDRRERVIQHVYEKYGALGAAMTANVITYRGRSAAREVGKALSLDAAQIDRLAKVMNQFEFVDPTETLARNLRDAGLDPAIRRRPAFAPSCGSAIQDLPRHLGQHSGGMVICQGGSTRSCRSRTPACPGRVVVQWDKDDCADMGIVKVDLLGLGMMAVLQDALTLVNGRIGSRAAKSDPARSGIPEDEPIRRPTPSATSRTCRPTIRPSTRCCRRPTRSASSRSSRARRWRRCRGSSRRSSTTSSSRSAIIRPGPIVGQMVHPYLKRRAGREPVTYPHPSLEPILARTLGVPLFQEQLLRMAMVAAGFTGGEAEELRRAMGFKRSEKRMQQIEVQLREGMARRASPARRRAHRPVDHVVRALRLSRIARRQLRAARLCERVSQGALPGGVLHGAAQQPADGVLPSGDARQGRAAPRRPLRADRRAGVRLGLPRRGRRPRPARADVRERPAPEAGRRSRQGPASGAGQAGESDAGERRCDEIARSASCVPKCGCDDQSMIERNAGRGGSATSARTSGRSRLGALAGPSCEQARRLEDAATDRSRS